MEETKTSPATWRASLQQLANNHGGPPRVALLGVGNVLRSDDAAGVLVVRELSKRMGGQDKQKILILEGGQAPENTTWELRRFSPALVLIVDAAEMGEAPGTIRWIPVEQIDGMSASTHSLPLSMLAHYLKLDLKCAVSILGIQAASNQLGDQVCPEVMRAVREVVKELGLVFRL